MLEKWTKPRKDTSGSGLKSFDQIRQWETKCRNGTLGSSLGRLAQILEKGTISGKAISELGLKSLAPIPNERQCLEKAHQGRAWRVRLKFWRRGQNHGKVHQVIPSNQGGQDQILEFGSRSRLRPGSYQVHVQVYEVAT